MSKAFTRDSDDAPEVPPPPRLTAPLPPGVKNYITAGGAQRLRDDFERLVQSERPRIAALPDPEARRRELQSLDQRIAQLQQSLQTAVVVAPQPPGDDQVRFGATITVQDARGQETRYRIVGMDETDLDRGWISWRSPIARALLNARRGQTLRVRLPLGEEEMKIVKVHYEADQ